MNKRIAFWLLLLTFFALCPVVLAQGKAQSKKTEAQTAQPQATETQKKNIEEYIELLRSNVRQEKAQLMGAGTAVAAARRGQQIEIPSESLLEFRLGQPVALPVGR